MVKRFGSTIITFTWLIQLKVQSVEYPTLNKTLILLFGSFLLKLFRRKTKCKIHWRTCFERLIRLHGSGKSIFIYIKTTRRIRQASRASEKLSFIQFIMAESTTVSASVIGFSALPSGKDIKQSRISNLAVNFNRRVGLHIVSNFEQRLSTRLT